MPRIRHIVAAYYALAGVVTIFLLFEIIRSAYTEPIPIILTLVSIVICAVIAILLLFNQNVEDYFYSKEVG